MSDVLPPADGAPAAVPLQRRQVLRPGADMRRRTGLVFLGLVLVVAAAIGFWFILQSVDDRQQYLMAARTIERFEVVTRTDFVSVNANVGSASAMTPAFIGTIEGLWAVSRIPAGTLVTPGLFGSPPLSGEEDEERVLIEVALPADEAAYGTLESGDRVALIGSEEFGLGASRVGLIGVLELETVQNGKIYYVVNPVEALRIENMVSRYDSASDRRIWKLGGAVTVDGLVAALEAGALSTPSALDEGFDEALIDDGAVPGAGLESPDGVPSEPAEGP